MSTGAPDPLTPILHRLASCIRMLLATDGQRTAAIFGVQRMLEGIGKDGNVDVHALADRVENKNGGLTEDYKRKVRSEIENARAIGYAEGVRAAEARFRPDGKLEFNEVALFVERQINRLPPDKHEFIHKMALYAVRISSRLRSRASFCSIFSFNISEGGSHERAAN